VAAFNLKQKKLEWYRNDSNEERIAEARVWFNRYPESYYGYGRFTK